MEKYCPTCETRHPEHYNLCPTDGTQLVEADELVGVTLSDTYEVSGILGEGGMGRVYEAHHTRIVGKRFAIKVLHEEFAREAHLLARFRREAEAAAAVDSPYVVGVYDVDETPDGRPFLVSELLEGVDLADYVAKSGKLPPGTALRIVRQVLAALSAAHAAGAVHRDLKPENVFLTGDSAQPVIKVIDFGISKFAGDGKALTRTGMIMGTPAYMSPEQARGERVDHRCDVYAAGAILYNALSARLPFEGDTAPAVIVQVLTAAPQSLSSRVPELPDALVAVVEKAMAAEPDERYQSAAELDAALEALGIEETRLDVERSGTLAASFGNAPAVTRRAAMAEQQSSRAKQARQWLLLLGASALAWLAMSLLLALTALARINAGGADASGAVVVVLSLAIALMLGAPGYLLWRRMRASLWSSDEQSLRAAELMRGGVTMAIVVYGLVNLFSRFVELVLLRGNGAAWPWWDVVALLASLTAAGLSVAAIRFRQHQLTASSLLGSLLGPLLERPVASRLSAAALMLVLLVVVPIARGAPSAGGAVGADAAALTEQLHDALEGGRIEQAVELLEELLAESPEAADSPKVRAAAMDLAMRSALAGGDLADDTFELLSSEMGSAGLDLLYELVIAKGGSAAAERAAKLLQDDAVRARGSDAMQVAYQLRNASDCDQLRPLLERAEEDGDSRSLLELSKLQRCERKERCCLRDDEAASQAVEAIKARAGGS